MTRSKTHLSETDAVVDRLRGDILDGVFAPGERLVELELAERYRCGRSAVRSALVHLQSEGLVDRHVNRGAVVHRILVSEAIQITEARMVLEGLIARLAARNATPDQTAGLGEIIDEMRDATARADAASYSDCNRRLHAMLRDISGHTIASELVVNLRRRGVQNQFRLAVMPGRSQESLTQHEAIVDAVAAGDEEGAARAMEAHLRSVIDVLAMWDTPR